MVPKVALIRQLIGITFCPKGSEAAVVASVAAVQSVHSIRDHFKRGFNVMVAKPASLYIYVYMKPQRR